MSANELKARIKELIDTEDVDYLNVVFKFASAHKGQNGNESLWQSLTEVQKQYILDAFSESEDQNNLVDNDDIRKKYEKWLSM